MDKTSIYKAIMAIAQLADEIGGPEGEEYVELMESLAAEFRERGQRAQEALEESMLIEANGQRFEYLTLNVMRDQMTESGTSIAVYGWGTYEESSVLAGQAKKVFLDSFPTEAEARAAYPMVTGFSSKWSEPQVSLNHLPDEDTPVAGGMFPDDTDDSDKYDRGDWSN